MLSNHGIQVWYFAMVYKMLSSKNYFQHR